MNNKYYTMPSGSASQYVPYYIPDLFERELISSYEEAEKNGTDALQKLSLSELRSLNENPDRMASFLKDSFLIQPMVKTMVSRRSKIKSEAEENLTLSPELDELRKDVQEKYDELQALQTSYKDANKIYLQLCQKYNPQNIAQGLHDSVAKIDEESEKIAETFLSGKTDLDNFLEEYVRHRSLSHSQKTKHDKLTNQLEKLHLANYRQS